MTSENPGYTRFHPKWHREIVPITWWTSNRRYFAFILRELTSVLVIYAGVLLLVQLVAIARGPDAHLVVQEWLRRPAVVFFHGMVLVGLILHSVTWMNLAPLAIVPRIRGRQVPAWVVLLAQYVAWVLISAVIMRVLIRTLPG